MTKQVFVGSATAIAQFTSDITISDDGNVTKSRQPMYLFSNATNQTNVSGDGTIVNPVIINAQITQQGNNFASNQFTAPVAGVYWIQVQLRTTVDFTSTQNKTYLVFTKPDTTTRNVVISMISGAMREASGNASIIQNGSTSAYMQAGETVKINFVSSGSTKVAGVNGTALTNLTMFFTGVKIA